MYPCSLLRWRNKINIFNTQNALTLIYDISCRIELIDHVMTILKLLWRNIIVITFRSVDKTRSRKVKVFKWTSITEDAPRSYFLFACWYFEEKHLTCEAQENQISIERKWEQYCEIFGMKHRPATKLSAAQRVLNVTPHKFKLLASHTKCFSPAKLMYKPELRFTASYRNSFPIYISSCFSPIAPYAEGFICRNFAIYFNHKGN